MFIFLFLLRNADMCVYFLHTGLVSEIRVESTAHIAGGRRA